MRQQEIAAAEEHHLESSPVLVTVVRRQFRGNDVFANTRLMICLQILFQPRHMTRRDACVVTAVDLPLPRNLCGHGQQPQQAFRSRSGQS